ncbi:mitochondrial pyruvate carrier [Morchella snyderi]|nr:mitochondrial pyruvate carrier [Morchella snyderi]
MSQAAAQTATKAMNPAFNPRTVHFWAPILKWGVVLAGIGDFYRPVETLSVTQNAALFATGTIWTRWCLIISPRNIPLAAVNFFLAGVGSVQLGRILVHNMNMKKNSPILSKLEEAKK